MRLMPSYDDIEPLCRVVSAPMSRSRFLRTLAALKARKPLAGLGLAVGVAVAAGVLTDVRWGIIALMLVTVVAPMVMAFLYIVHAISPRCLQNVHARRVEIFPRYMAVTYEVPGIPADGDDEPEPRLVRFEVGKEELASVRVRPADVLVTMRAPFGFIILPYDDASDGDALVKWARALNF